MRRGIPGTEQILSLFFPPARNEYLTFNRKAITTSIATAPHYQIGALETAKNRLAEVTNRF